MLGYTSSYLYPVEDGAVLILEGKQFPWVHASALAYCFCAGFGNMEVAGSKVVMFSKLCCAILICLMCATLRSGWLCV